jgi:hypothetical protein
MDRFVVRNNLNSAFRMDKYKLTFAPSTAIDLVGFLKRSTAEIKKDIHIMGEINAGNLIIVEEVDEASDKNDEMSKKLDLLIGLLAAKKSDSQEGMLEAIEDLISKKLGNVQGGSVQKVEEKSKEDDEERMREKALEIMIQKDRKKFDGNTDGFGKQNRIIEEENGEDFSDLLDF